MTFANGNRYSLRSHRGELRAVCPPLPFTLQAQRSITADWRRPYIVPPPRRRASPSMKKKGGVCSHLVLVRHKPVLHVLKGEGAAPSRSCGLSGRKKRKHRVSVFFCPKSASVPPRRQSAKRGVVCPPMSRFTSC